MLKKIIILLNLIVCVATFADEKTPVFNSPKEKIVVSQKQPTFTITLQSNPTTGFSWKLGKYDSKLVSFVSQQHVTPKNKKLMGAPGYDVWTFKAIKATYRVNQVGHITLIYARPWTKDGATKATFMIMVKK